MLWWEREGCRVRRGEEGNKKNERGIEKEERSCWTSEAAKKIIKGEDFWAAKQIRDVDNWGGLRVVLGKKNITATFSNFLAFTLTYIYIYIYSLHSHLPTQNSITLHTHIYPYLYKVTSITLKEHIGSIISQKSKFHAQK